MRKRLTILKCLVATLLLVFAGGCVMLTLQSVRYGIVAFSLWALSVLITVVLLVQYRRWLMQVMVRLTDTLTPQQRQALEDYPMPVAILSGEAEILFGNQRFLRDVAKQQDIIGSNAVDLLVGLTVRDLRRKNDMDIRCEGSSYTTYVYPCDDGNFVLYFCENTALKEIAAEYTASRPVALLICIDNLEEAARNLREGERTRIAGQIETMLDDWISRPGGVLRKFGSDRFMAIIECRHLNDMTKERFAILDNVRKSFAEVKPGITVSIGVGQGKSLQECERMAKQALEMALARGGDQAAIKTANGYDFYGGRSKGVERRTKVRTRVMANALRDLMVGSDTVFVMGHRLSDLDSLGSAIALSAAARRLGIPSYVVVNSDSSMAEELIRRYTDEGQKDLFMEPEDALLEITNRSLLIITDTHTEGMLDSPELFRAATRVAIIDHHRKMANAITGAELEYQESSSSSACELVAELLPYIGDDLIAKQDAEALLSGIMLDTRNFVLRTGVRTFEAAAQLRRLGADTVSVKRMFSDSLVLYRKKCELVSNARIYHRIAIASTQEDCTGKRTAAAQAADELMSIHGTVASFVIFPSGSDVNISARSYGEFNVQLIMEAMGGGGHMTMAGTQVPNETVKQVEQRLVETLTDFIDKNHLDI